MGDLPGGFEFPPEPLAAERVERDFLPQQLERHGPVELPVPGVVDDRRRSFADALTDFVARQSGVGIQTLPLLL